MGLMEGVIIFGLVMLVLGVLATIVNVGMWVTRPRRTTIIFYDDDDLEDP